MGRGSMAAAGGAGQAELASPLESLKAKIQCKQVKLLGSDLFDD